jgi:hypothetical protein
MDYKGKIYGKVGNSYFPLRLTADDVDNLQASQKECLKVLKQAKQLIDFIKGENLNLWSDKKQMMYEVSASVDGTIKKIGNGNNQNKPSN